MLGECSWNCMNDLIKKCGVIWCDWMKLVYWVCERGCVCCLVWVCLCCISCRRWVMNIFYINFYGGNGGGYDIYIY